MTPEQIERLLKALETLVVSSRPDPYHDLKVFVLGVMTALIAAFVGGCFSHWLTVRREEEKRKLREWERLKDWDRDGRKDDLRSTDLTPPGLWLRLRLPYQLARRLPRPRYLDLAEVNLGADVEHKKVANLTRAKLPWADLEGVDLLGAHLRDGNLQRANLKFANLQGAILWSANLQEAIMWGARLQGASLWGANLQRADLSSAKLQGADLVGADLQRAILVGANLEGTRWNDATVWPEGFTPPPEAVKVEE